MRSEPDGSSPAVACTPRSRICVGNSVRACSSDGLDFQLDACGAGTTCVLGTCVDIIDSCVGDQPFAISATSLTYDVTSDFKTQTGEVSLQSCSDRPILIRSAAIRSPERPDGTPVFRLAGPFHQTLLPKGGIVDFKVEYRPTPGLSHVEGRLELGLVIDELTNIEIELRSKASCSSITSLLDFGIVTDNEDAILEGVVQNCGTEPFRINRQMPGARVGVTAREELPHTLGSGEEMTYAVPLPVRPDLGVLEDVVWFELEGGQELASAVRAFVARVDCAELGTPSTRIVVNNRQGPPHPGALVRLDVTNADEEYGGWATMIAQPDGARESLGRVTSGWLWRPRVVGTYEFALRGIDLETSQVSCKTANLAVDVLPLRRLHVELTWRSLGDGIPSDLGFGTGVNLDLHVLSSREDERGTWNDPAYDCFAGILGPCGVADGRIATSQSGGIPEFAEFDELDGHRFEVGVYLSNPFNYDGVEARLRVYLDGELVDEMEGPHLQSANDFWLVGTFDGTTETWTPIDRTFSGFPR